MTNNDYFGGFLLLYLFGIAIYIYIVYTSGVERYKFSYAAMHVYFVNLFFPQKEMELSGGVGHIT
jgi:hypothetical protein